MFAGQPPAVVKRADGMHAPSECCGRACSFRDDIGTAEAVPLRKGKTEDLHRIHELANLCLLKHGRVEAIAWVQARQGAQRACDCNRAGKHLFACVGMQ